MQQLVEDQLMNMNVPVNVRRRKIPAVATVPAAAAVGGEDKEDTFEDADEEVVYSNYKPAMLRIGHEHPDLLVQSASLAAVLPPPITYEVCI